MEKKNQQRRPSRPVSELVTLFDHQKAEKPKRGQWRSEISLSTTKSPKMDNKRNASSLIPSGISELSKYGESVPSCEVEYASNKNSGKARASTLTEKPKLKLALKPTKMSVNKEKPVVKTTKSKTKEKEDIIERPTDTFKNETKKKKDPQRKVSSGSESESCARQKFPLDDSLAVLRREMVSGTLTKLLDSIVYL